MAETSGGGIAGAVTRRGQLAAFAGLAAGPVVAACGPAAPEGQPGPSGQPVTVVYYNNLNAVHPESVARLALLGEFNAGDGQALGITADLRNAAGGAGGNQQGGTDGTKIKAMVSAGTPPDLYYTAYYDSAEYYVAGMTVDLDAELKGVKAWPAQRADMFPAYAESSAWLGKLVGMPGYTNVTGFIWNKGLLQQAGLAEPQWGWTWTDFLEKASRFAGREGIVPLSFGWYWYGEWLGTTGTHEISPDRKRITFDTPEMLDVMQFWLELLKRKIVLHNPDPTVRSGLAEQYRQAKNDTPFEQQGVYRLVTLRQVNAPDFGVIHTPVHPAKKVVHTANGGHNLLVFKDVKPETRAAAARLAMWMNAPYAQSQMVIRGTAVPVSKAAMSDPKLNEFLKSDPHLAGFLKLAPYGWRFPSLPSRADVTGVLGKAVEAIMYEEIGPKAGLQRAQQEAQVLLDKDVALMK